jgi:hypothetical protein
MVLSLRYHHPSHKVSLFLLHILKDIQVRKGILLALIWVVFLKELFFLFLQPLLNPNSAFFRE